MYLSQMHLWSATFAARQRLPTVERCFQNCHQVWIDSVPVSLFEKKRYCPTKHWVRHPRQPRHLPYCMISCSLKNRQLCDWVTFCSQQFDQDNSTRALVATHKEMGKNFLKTLSIQKHTARTQRCLFMYL